MATDAPPSLTGRPDLDATQVAAICSAFGFAVTSQKEVPGYDDQNVAVTGTTSTGEEATAFLKVTRLLTPTHRVKVELQAAAIAHLQRHHACVPPPFCVSDRTGDAAAVLHPSLVLHTDTREDKEGVQYMARLFAYCPGPLLADTPYTDGNLQEFGAAVGHLVRTLQSLVFLHPSTRRPSYTPLETSATAHLVPPTLPDGSTMDALDFPTNVWDLQNTLMVRAQLPHVTDDDLRAVLAAVLDEFEAVGLPGLATCTRGWIHGDLNDQNVIMRRVEDGGGGDDDRFTVAAFIDFEDLAFSAVVNELGVCLAYMFMQFCKTSADPIAIGCNVLCGFVRRYPLPTEELKLLHLLVMTRLTVSIIMSQASIAADPSNEQYLSIHAVQAVPLLHHLRSLSSEEVTKRYLDVVAAVATDAPVSKDE